MALGNSILGSYKFGGIPYIAQYQNALQNLIKRCVPEVIGIISASAYYKYKSPTSYAWFPLFMRKVIASQPFGNRYVNIITLTKAYGSNQRITNVSIKCNGSVIPSTTTSISWSESAIGGYTLVATKTVIDTNNLLSSGDNPLKVILTVENSATIYSRTFVFVEYQQSIVMKKLSEIYKLQQNKASDFLMTSLVNSGMFSIANIDHYQYEPIDAVTGIAIPEKLNPTNYFKIAKSNGGQVVTEFGTPVSCYLTDYKTQYYRETDNNDTVVYTSSLDSFWLVYEYNSSGVKQREVRPVVTFYRIYSKKTKIVTNSVNQKSLNDVIHSAYNSLAGRAGWENSPDKEKPDCLIEQNWDRWKEYSPVQNLTDELKVEDYSVVNGAILTLNTSIDRPLNWGKILNGDGNILTKDTTTLLYRYFQ